MVIRHQIQTSKCYQMILRVVFFSIAVFSVGCGGGSAGTGEPESFAQLLDSSCQPLKNIDLAMIGINGSADQFSGYNGEFKLLPDSEGLIQIPNSQSSPMMVPASDPICVIITTRDNMIAETLVFPRSELSDCNIEAVRERFPADLRGLCP